jgi:hypothetical protein
MPIPASGPISMSMFNTELGRTSNTANSSLAGGITPTVGSQFWLGGQSGSLNQSAPHAMSEWYGYTSARVVNLYARVGLASIGNAIFYTSYDGCTYTYRGELTTNTCTLLASFNPTNNTNLYIAVTRLSGLDEVYITFNAAAGTTTCPTNVSNYCVGGYAAALGDTTNIAVTAYATKFGFVDCTGSFDCGDPN